MLVASASRLSERTCCCLNPFSVGFGFLGSRIHFQVVLTTLFFRFNFGMQCVAATATAFGCGELYVQLGRSAHWRRRFKRTHLD